jgi:chromate reductase, NAD(P)H dehydrogenase (quinone)
MDIESDSASRYRPANEPLRSDASPRHHEGEDLMNLPPDGKHAAQPPVPTRFLLFSASLRAESLNTRLARLAARTIEQCGGRVDLASMKEFDCPSYNQDVEDREGIPPGAAEFRRRLEANDAFVIVSPEYNASMPGLLKNAIDWVSRYRPQPFNERHALLMSASPAMAGGNRGLWSLRIPLEHLGARVFPDMFSLAAAHQALSADGEILNPQLGERFANNIVAFMNLVEAAKHYPCIKKAWVEFLGEQPDPVIDRVEQ